MDEILKEFAFGQKSLRIFLSGKSLRILPFGISFLVKRYLGDILRETGRLAISGTGSMNIRLNQRLSSIPEVKNYIVHPACSDAVSYTHLTLPTNREV